MIQSGNNEITGTVPEHMPASGTVVIAPSHLKVMPNRFATKDNVLKLIKRVGYRFFRLFGEFTAIALGLAFFWVCAINILLAQKTLDISFLKPNAALWFSSAFEGKTADIGDLNLEWHARDNTITFQATNIIVKDAAGVPIQTINRLQSDLALQDVISARLDPVAVAINGGQITYKRRADGRAIAGLGTPETVGGLGPIWKSDGQGRDTTANGFRLKQAQFRNVSLFILDERDGLALSLSDTALTIARDGDKIRFDAEGQLSTNDDTSIQSAISTSGKISHDFNDLDIIFHAQSFNPAKILPATGALSVGRLLDAAIDLKAVMKANADAGLTALSITANVGAGTVSTPDRTHRFNTADLTADYDVDARALNVSNLSVDSEFIRATGTAKLRDIGTPVDGFFNDIIGYEVEFSDITLDMTPKFEQPLRAVRFGSSGQFDAQANKVVFDELKVDFGVYQFDLAGAFDRDPDGAIEQIDVHGKINGIMTRDELLSLWPSQYILGARNWIKNSIIRANLSNFDIMLNADAEALAQPTLPNEALLMTFDLAAMDVRYIRTMTPVVNAFGQGKLEGNRATAVLDRGTVGNIMLSHGIVEIPRIYPHGGSLNIAADGEGPVEDLLAIIDEKPFEYVSKYGVEASTFSGDGKIRLSLTRPLREKIAYSDITYTVTGNLSDVSAPFSMGKYSLQNGHVSVLADSKGLSVKGPISLGPWDANLVWTEQFDEGATPTRYRIEGALRRDDLDAFGLGFREYIDGDIFIKIDATADGLEISGATVTADLEDTSMRLGPYWSKAPGVAGQLRGVMSFAKVAGLSLRDIHLEAPGLNVMGSLDLAGNFRLINLDLQKAKIAGFIDAAVQMKPSAAQDKFDVLVTGDYLDVSPFVTGMIGGQSGQTLDVPVLLTAALGRLALDEAYVLRDANILFAHDGIGVRQARLKGVGEDGDVVVNLRTDEQNLQRVLRLDIPNASDAAFAFFDLESVTGGRLEVDATMPITGIEGPIIGEAKMVDMQLVGAPIMTRILSLASLQGLTDAMSGERLNFDDIKVPFSLDGYKLSVRSGRASSSALGMTGNGEIDFGAKALDFDGVLVPAYTANSLLGGIPLIGDIFVGNKGEGIFALSYTVRGPFEKSQVAVNPLSALTPGFLRGIFKPQREKLPEQLLSDIQDVKPSVVKPLKDP